MWAGRHMRKRHEETEKKEEQGAVVYCKLGYGQEQVVLYIITERERRGKIYMTINK